MIADEEHASFFIGHVLKLRQIMTDIVEDVIILNMDAISWPNYQDLGKIEAKRLELLKHLDEFLNLREILLQVSTNE